MFRHVKNYFLAIHYNGLAISYLGTLTPLAYPLTVLLAAPWVTFIGILDLEELERMAKTSSKE